MFFWGVSFKSAQHHSFHVVTGVNIFQTKPWENICNTFVKNIILNINWNDFLNINSSNLLSFLFQHVLLLLLRLSAAAGPSTADLFADGAAEARAAAAAAPHPADRCGTLGFRATSYE